MDFSGGRCNQPSFFPWKSSKHWRHKNNWLRPPLMNIADSAGDHWKQRVRRSRSRDIPYILWCVYVYIYIWYTHLHTHDSQSDIHLYSNTIQSLAWFNRIFTHLNMQAKVSLKRSHGIKQRRIRSATMGYNGDTCLLSTKSKLMGSSHIKQWQWQSPEVVRI